MKRLAVILFSLTIFACGECEDQNEYHGVVLYSYDGMDCHHPNAVFSVDVLMSNGDTVEANIKCALAVLRPDSVVLKKNPLCDYYIKN